MITDTSITNKILTFFPPNFADVPASFFEVKTKKTLQKRTFVETKLHQTDKEPMIYAHEDLFNN